VTFGFVAEGVTEWYVPFLCHRCAFQAASGRALTNQGDYGGRG
jgi:hypothetical protein